MCDRVQRLFMFEVLIWLSGSNICLLISESCSRGWYIASFCMGLYKSADYAIWTGWDVLSAVHWICKDPWWSPSLSLYGATPPSPQEAANAAVLVLQSIFSGSEGVKVTPSPVRKAIQESKQEKPRQDCTYCTGKSGLNVLTMARRAIFLSLSTNLSIRYEAMRGASWYSLKKRW